MNGEIMVGLLSLAGTLIGSMSGVVAVAGNHTSLASEVIELIRGEQYHTYRFAEDLVRYYSYET